MLGSLRAARLRGWGGVPWMGAGVVVSALATYAFLTVAARALGSEEFGHLGILWTGVFLVSNSVFVPLEQATSWWLSSASDDDQKRKRFATVAGFAASVIGMTLLLTGVGALVLHRLFGGSLGIAFAGITALLGYGIGSVGRGLIASESEFRRYAALLVVETGSRAVLVFAVIAVVPSLLAVAALVALGPLLGLFLQIRPLSRFHSGIVSFLAGFRGELGRSWISGVSVAAGAQALLNGGPLLARSFGASPGEVGLLFAAVLLARVPAYLFQSVTVAFLPRFSALAAGSSPGSLPGEARRLLGIVAVVGVGGSIFAYVGGPELARLLLGEGFALPRVQLTALVVGVSAYLVAQSATQALYAARLRGRLLRGWGIGVAVLGGSILLLPASPVDRYVVGFVFGCLIAAIVLTVSLRKIAVHGRGVRSGSE